MRYIARQHDLCGKTDEEKIRVDIMENELMDFRNRFVVLCYKSYVRIYIITKNSYNHKSYTFTVRDIQNNEKNPNYNPNV